MACLKILERNLQIRFQPKGVSGERITNIKDVRNSLSENHEIFDTVNGIFNRLEFYAFFSEFFKISKIP